MDTTTCLHRSVLLALVLVAGCARPDATLPADQPAAVNDTTTAPVPSVASEEVATGLAAAGMHTEGLLRGVPTTCQLAEHVRDGDTADAVALIRAELADGLGPMVVVAADDEAVLAVTGYGPEGPSAPAMWVVEADGTIQSVAGTAAEATSFGTVSVDTAGEGPRSRALAEASDCSWIAADAADTRPEPPPPSPEIRPDLVTLDPDPAAPGTTVELSFPNETTRGVAFQLDRRTDDGWDPVAWMTSDGNGDDPVTVPVGTEGHGTIDVGVGGPGPDAVVLPDDLDAGAYRICTANRGDPEICAELTVG